ncbi:MAG: D-alanyl-D-alanine carboxypeptidase/D-alanyl-D-alanine-endopeptidase, partial [Proteobacteria bacterium]|nr:D-alanyl-D-alanine carboxypeptidase/D-alanyl-D-alanine-endopeptidase [Pseudomonadota bacterium]
MKAKLPTYLCLFIILFLAGCSSNNDDLLYSKKPAFYTYIIGDIDSPNSQIEKDADVFIAPASCQKIVTTLLAYKTLGNDFCYQTKLWVIKKNNQIEDVIIEFSGDPTLKSEDLLKLLEPLESIHINGKIILDNSAFNTPPQSPNRMIDDIGTWYAQPVSAMNLDENLVSITVTPSTLFKPAVITNDAGYFLVSGITTDFKKSNLKLVCEGEKLKAEGTINITDKPVELTISPIDIDGFVLNKIRQILKAKKITGKVVIANVKELKEKAELLATHKSQPIAVFLPPALQCSDNFVFDSLYLTIIHSQDAASIKKWEEGDKIIKALIKQHFGIAMEKALFIDGSGLSRYNRVQPRQLFELLQNGFAVKEFVNALPFPTQPKSNLAKRLTLPAHIRAKTGSMSGI